MPGLRFGAAPRFFVCATSLRLFAQSLSVLMGVKPRLLACLDSVYFFFHGPEPRFGAPAHFFFLGALSRLSFEVTPLFFRPAVCLVGLRLTQRCQLGLVRLLRRAQPFIHFAATALLDQSESGHFVLCARDFRISDLTLRLFLRPFVGFSIDPLTLVFRALPGRLFFLLMPSLLFHAKRSFGGDSRGFGFRAPRFFFPAQPSELGF